MDLSTSLAYPSPQTALITCAGDLDAYTAPTLRESVHGVSASTQLLVIDLAATTFIDSSGLGVLVGAHRRMLERGGGLRIVEPAPLVARIFALVGLEHVLDLRATRDDAIDA